VCVYGCTPPQVPEDSILHGHSRKDPKPNILDFLWHKRNKDTFNYSVLLAITKEIVRCISRSLEANFETDRDFQKATDTPLQTPASEMM
jgi:hypothetical protein